MAETLLLRLPEREDEPVDWLIVGDQRRPLTEPGREPLESLATRAAGRRIVALVSGERVLLTDVHIPARSGRQLRRAVPYALEEQVVDDVETLHFAVGERSGTGRVPVAVCARSAMDEWLGRLQSAGLDPARLIPEPLALPWETGTWSVLTEEGRACLRTGVQSGFAADRDNLRTVLELTLAEEGTTAPQRLVHYAADGSELESPDEGIPVETRDEGPALTVLARGLDERRCVDLRQGAYSQSAELGRVWRPWRAAAVVAVGLLVAHLAGTGLEQYRLSQQKAKLDEQIESVYREAFPDARRVVNARAQMEQGLQALRDQTGGTGGGLIDLLAECGPILAEKTGLEITGLRYRQGTLSVDLTIGNLQALDELKQTIADRDGLEAEIQGATSQDERVEGRLEIRRQT